ncbi:MAG: hypothetical protein JSV92_00340, partial [archaeon]
STSCIDRPLWLKISYFPNWQAEGANLYLASPSFMMIYPEKEDVRIYYGSTFLDILGTVVSYAGIAFIILYAFRKKLPKFKTKPEKIKTHGRHPEKTES